MAIGGFSGTDAWRTLGVFQRYVAGSDIHDIDGGGVGGSGSSTSSEIATCVAADFTATTVGGVTLDDLLVAGVMIADTGLVLGAAGWRQRVGQLLRYGSVSVIATATSLLVLAVLVSTGAAGAAGANVIATIVGMVPSFELNRRWVWGVRGRPSLRRQVVPFAALSSFGLVLSTAAVAVAAGIADRSDWSTSTTTAVVVAANLATFGAVWLAQFVVLDRILFRDRPVMSVAASGGDGKDPPPGDVGCCVTSSENPSHAASPSPEIVVYWRPGCGFCSSLFRQLDAQSVTYRKIDIWSDPEAAGIVRSVNRGNETVPTVVIGPASLCNPTAREVIALAAEHAPQAVGRR